MRQFYLHKRGGIFYCCLVNQKTGLAMSARSTGKADRDSALIVVSGWLRDGLPTKGGGHRKVAAEFDLDGILRVIRKADLDSTGAAAIVTALQERGLIGKSLDVTAGKPEKFTDFLSEFWDFDKSQYVREKLAFGQHIGRRHCQEMFYRLAYYRDFFGDRELKSITRQDMKSFSMFLSETIMRKTVKKLSAGSINKVIIAGSTALSWAFREGLITVDPSAGLMRFSGASKKRGVLDVGEAEALFSNWADCAAKTASLVSATTGLRQGEVLAIRAGDIWDGILCVEHSWSEKDGLKSPKNGETRKVPLLPEIRKALLAELAKNPHTETPELERYVFWGQSADRPRSDGKFMLAELHAELEKMDIDWKSRNIVFHGWRHFYASKMIDIETAERVSRVTGHKSRAVFDAYANHVSETAVFELGKAAASVFGGITGAAGSD